MARYVLILSTPEGQQHFDVPPAGLVIGRSPEADIVLADQSVSRKHAKVSLHGNALFVEDMGSRNGIIVRETQVSQATLKAGDTFIVGGTTFEVVKHQGVAAGKSIIDFDASSTLCARLASEETERFPLILRATQLLASVFDMDQLLSQILDLIFDAVPAERGFVLTLAADSNEPQVRASRTREDAHGAPPISRTLVNRVIFQRESVLTTDAQDDRRFQAAQSVVGHAIRAAMCVPLYGRDNVLGAIYVDAGSGAHEFSQADFELLTVVGRIVGVAVENAQLHHDMLEQERLAALGQAMAGVGHCVKNILNGIRGGTHFIDRAAGNAGPEFIEKGWPILRRAMERIDMLVMNMLSFAQTPQLNRHGTDLDTLCAEVIDLVRPRAEKLKVELRHEHGAGAKAWVDERGIYRILLNLVTNALDACEDQGGVVTVSTACDSSGCTITVSDTGPGVDEEVLHKLGGAFVSTKGSQGIGLGLACSYRIAQAHGGAITVHTEPGQGAQFTVHLPSDTSAGGG